MGLYPRGHLVLPREQRGSRTRRATKATAPSSASLLQFSTVRFNQGGLGTCEGCSISGAAATRMAFLGQPLAAPPSYIGIYKNALCIGLADPTTSTLTDTGTTTDAAVAALQTWGLPSMSGWGDVLQDGTPDMTAFPNRPTQTQLEAAISLTFGGAQFLTDDMGSDQVVIDILNALASGYPVCTALPASGSAFQNYTGGVLTGAQMTGPVDHANYIIACELGTPGNYSTAVFTLINSWTSAEAPTGWGAIAKTCGSATGRHSRSSMNRAYSAWNRRESQHDAEPLRDGDGGLGMVGARPAGHRGRVQYAARGHATT